MLQVPWRSAGGQLEGRCRPGQLLRGPGAILTSNNKYSVPYAVPQDPRAVTKILANAVCEFMAALIDDIAYC